MTVDLFSQLPKNWYQELLLDSFQQEISQISTGVSQEYKENICFPQYESIFRAFEYTPPKEVKVVIIGQDPYHTPQAAQGLAFSINQNSPIQSSLRNIFKELKEDIGISRTQTDLSDWAKQGVLLLNTALTVRSGAPASHGHIPWNLFTIRVLQYLSARRKGCVYMLWGAHAQSYKKYIQDTSAHIIASVHPSGLSAHRGFFGSRPFSQCNNFLRLNGKIEIQWGGERTKS